MPADKVAAPGEPPGRARLGDLADDGVGADERHQHGGDARADPDLRAVARAVGVGQGRPGCAAHRSSSSAGGQPSGSGCQIRRTRPARGLTVG
jgi:hypothetical protein